MDCKYIAFPWLQKIYFGQFSKKVLALSFVRLKMKYFCSMNIFSGTLLDWYAENKRDLPWRNTTDPYLIWISEIILQQTRVAQGYEYFLRFIKRFPDVVSLAAASEDEVMHGTKIRVLQDKNKVPVLYLKTI